MKIGYLRVSKEDQNLDLQRSALEKAGVEKFYSDQLTGSDNDRPGLRDAFKALQPGDTFVVWKLDRMSRNLRHILEMIDFLGKSGVEFRSVTENLDTSSAMGRAMFQIVAVFAELERGIIIQRTKEGLAAARARGVKFGRRRKITDGEIARMRELKARGASCRQIALEMKISPDSVSRLTRDVA